MKKGYYMNIEIKCDLVRVRESALGEIYIDSYTGNERDSENHIRDTVKISSGDVKITGHGPNHEKYKK